MQDNHFLLTLVVVWAIVFCGCGKTDPKRGAETPTAPAVPAANVTARPTNLMFKYSYDGEFGIAGIADKAEAHAGGRLVAQAKALRIIEQQSGPNHVEVEETHYSETGTETYKGKIVIQFGFDGGRIISETPVSGTRPFQVFSGWKVN